MINRIVARRGLRKMQVIQEKCDKSNYLNENKYAIIK
jgi:hypothetical protein